MDGVTALRAALAGDAALTALVPPARISGGVQPQGTALPAISLAQVSGIGNTPLAKGATRRRVERVQATVLAKTYPELRALLKEVVHAADHARPAVSGITDVLVLYDSDGPDFMDEMASIYLGTRDFMVSYTEAT